MKLETKSFGTQILDDRHCLCNDIVFPDEYNPHNVRPWLIGSECGALALVWAECEQDALGEACDNDLLNAIRVEEVDADEDTARLGNASEPFDLTYAWLEALVLTPQQERTFAEARGARCESLADL